MSKAEMQDGLDLDRNELGLSLSSRCTSSSIGIARVAFATRDAL